MKQLKMSKNKMTILIISALLVIIIGLLNNVFGMQYYQKVDFSTGLVTATTLNVRQGPGVGYKVVTTVKKNEYIRVFAKIGSWYVIQTDSDYIGAVSAQYVKAIYPGSSSNNTSQNNTSSGSGTTTNSNISSDEQEVLNLINQQRANAGLSKLQFDSELQRVARIKAQDMVNNNYFSHNSPTYGTPFEMMKNFGISYKTAGENIAGNSTNKGAVDAWMGSAGHKANILNNSFNYTGIGVVNSPKYGKIYVQMFIGK